MSEGVLAQKLLHFMHKLYRCPYKQLCSAYHRNYDYVNVSVHV